jgi:hypothetical protein
MHQIRSSEGNKHINNKRNWFYGIQSSFWCSEKAYTSLSRDRRIQVSLFRPVSLRSIFILSSHFFKLVSFLCVVCFGDFVLFDLINLIIQWREQIKNSSCVFFSFSLLLAPPPPSRFQLSSSEPCCQTASVCSLLLVPIMNLFFNDAFSVRDHAASMIGGLTSMEQLVEWELVEEAKYWDKTWLSVTINPTPPDLGSKPGRRSGKPAPNPWAMLRPPLNLRD